MSESVSVVSVSVSVTASGSVSGSVFVSVSSSLSVSLSVCLRLCPSVFIFSYQCMQSDATAEPPGESTRRMITDTRGSSAA